MREKNCYLSFIDKKTSAEQGSDFPRVLHRYPWPSDHSVVMREEVLTFTFVFVVEGLENGKKTKAEKSISLPASGQERTQNMAESWAKGAPGRGQW